MMSTSVVSKRSVTASYICRAVVTGTSVVNLTGGSAVCPWIRVTSAPRMAAARARA